MEEINEIKEEIRNESSQDSEEGFSAEYSISNDEDANTKLKKKMDEGEDLLGLKDLDNGLHNKSESTEEHFKRMKKEENEAKKLEMSEKEELLTEERLQHDLKTSLLNEERHRIDVDKDTERVNQNTKLDIVGTMDDIENKLEKKNVKEEVLKTESDFQSDVDNEKLKNELEIDINDQPNSNLSIYPVEQKPEGMVVKEHKDGSVSDNSNNGKKESLLQDYTLQTDIDVQNQAKTQHEVTNMLDVLDDLENEEEKKKKVQTYDSQDDMKKKNNLELNPDDTKLFKYKSYSDKYQEKLKKENKEKDYHADIPELIIDEKNNISDKPKIGKDNAVIDDQPLNEEDQQTSENLPEENNEDNTVEGTNDDQTHVEGTEDDQNHVEGTEDDQRDSITIFKNMILSVFILVIVARF